MTTKKGAMRKKRDQAREREKKKKKRWDIPASIN